MRSPGAVRCASTGQAPRKPEGKNSATHQTPKWNLARWSGNRISPNFIIDSSLRAATARLPQQAEGEGSQSDSWAAVATRVGNTNLH